MLSAVVEQVAMAALVVALGAMVVVCEVVRVALVVLRTLAHCRNKAPAKTTARTTVLVDGECAVCSALRTFVVFRTASEDLEFVTAQDTIRTLNRYDGNETTRALAAHYPTHEAISQNLLARLHAVVEDNGRREVVVGADVVLGLLEICDAPYGTVAAAARACCPRSVTARAYDAFARNRRAWFPAWLAGPKGATAVDDSARLRQVFVEATAMAAALFACLTVVVLPLGDGHKDGPTQHATRLVGAALMSLALASQGVAAESFARRFQEQYVGNASPQSLAIVRATAAWVLFVFTTPFMTAPLAETAEVPRFMCKPTGVLRLLGDAAPWIFGRDELLGSAARLDMLQFLTRVALGLVGIGFATNVTAPFAAVAWLVYGGVLRSYNSWRGHSFIAAWWALVVLAWRGGSNQVWSLDALLKPRAQRSSRQDAAYRGWTRFMVTLVLANNYMMAGLSKFCASGVAWAFGANLKAKLLQTSLTQGSFGVYLSLALRHWPLPFWHFLGACGLYGEIAMGLVPFDSIAKLTFPALMWGMHLGIILLQHIVFVDLLTMIPAWYAWHAVDLRANEPQKYLYAGGPWDWTRVARDCRARIGLPAPVYAASPQEDDDSEDPDEEGGLDDVAISSSRRAVALVACFVAVWAQGAEWYPWNAFRMFADWTPNPLSYDRYVALDANRNHLRNFHMHELNPVLNRKRFVDALDLCASRGPADQNCAAFLRWIDPIATALPLSPAFLVYQDRHWDFVRSIDEPDFCTQLTAYEYDVRNNRVTKRDHVPCDPIDWHLCCTRTIGTI